jgi:hypothetical protein
MSHRSSRGRNITHQRLGIGVSQSQGHRILLLHEEPVSTATTSRMQGVTRIKEKLCSGIHIPMWHIGDPRRCQGTQNSYIS